MDDLLKKYYSKIAPVLAERGFLRKGRMFGRIVNDVFQGASIEKLRRGQAFRECRIEFGVWPLCEGLTLSRCLDFCDWYYLRQFEVFHDYAVRIEIEIAAPIRDIGVQLFVCHRDLDCVITCRHDAHLFG